MKSGVDKLIKLLIHDLSGELRKEIDSYFKLDIQPVNNGVAVLDQLQVCKFITEDLRADETIKMSAYKNICDKNGIDSRFIDKIEYSKNLDKELMESALRLKRYLVDNFTTDEIISIRNEWINEDEGSRKSEKVRTLMLKLFDNIIKSSEENKKIK